MLLKNKIARDCKSCCAIFFQFQNVRSSYLFKYLAKYFLPWSLRNFSFSQKLIYQLFQFLYEKNIYLYEDEDIIMMSENDDFI